MAPPATPLRDMTPDEAREFVRQVRGSVQEIRDWIIREVQGRAWMALGYASWDQLCEAEFDGAVIRLPARTAANWWARCARPD
jgi:hypothetical protein